MKSTVSKIFLMGLAWLALSCGPPQGGVETAKKSSGTSIQTPGASGASSQASYKLVYTTISEAYVPVPTNNNTIPFFNASGIEDSTTTTQHKYQFMLLGLSGGTPIALTPSDFDIWAPHPSPNGEYIAFPKGGQIALLNRRTNNSIAPLTNFSSSDLFSCYIGTRSLDSPQYCLSWSSDSREIVFEKGSSPSQKIYKIDIQTSQLTEIASQKNLDKIQPIFSPKSKRIVFVAVSGFTSNLWLIEENGSIRQLTNLGGYLDKPSWSPDETKIAFVHDSKVKYIETTSSAISSAHETIAGRTQVEDGHPVWSPDSSHLAFTTDDLASASQNLSINTYDLNTGQPKSIIDYNFGIAGGISWLNNDEIIFLSNKGSGTPYNVYKTLVSSPNPQVLTNSLNGNYHLKLIRDISP